EIEEELLIEVVSIKKISKRSSVTKIRMCISGVLLVRLWVLSMYIPEIKEINSGLSGLIINGILIAIFVYS
ncbi:MAG: hypothetical protein ABS939_20530, partial [Psychrobacillus sp.]